jgi:tetratricopeptide (TPR) repeat protein
MNSGAYGNRGLAHYAIGQYDQAVVDLSEAITRDPRSAVARLNRADVFARLGMRERAGLDLEAASRLDPRLVATYTKTHRLDSDRESHAPEHDMALLLAPEEVSSHYQLANASRERGDWLIALKEYDRVLATKPDQTDAYVARGWTRLCAGAEGAADDAHAYCTRKGWGDPFTPYMAVLEALALSSPASHFARRKALNDSIGHLNARAWPTPVLHYLRGDLNEMTLLRDAIGPRQQSEAHAFLGIERMRSGETAQGTFHLRKAIELGSAGSIATDISRAMLDRQGLPTRQP